MKLLSQKEIIDFLESKKALFDWDWQEIKDASKDEIEREVNKSLELDNFHTKVYWKQSIIVLAGIFMNFVLSFFLFFLLFLFWVRPIGINDQIETSVQSKLIPTYEQAIESGLLKVSSGVLVYPLKDSLSARVWLQQGDIITQINSQDISLKTIRSILLKNKEKETRLSILRGDKKITLLITPNKEGKIEAYISDNISYNQDFIYKYSFTEALSTASSEIYSQSILTLQAMKHLFFKIFFPKTDTERWEAVKALSGPIGITSVITQWVTLWFSFLIVITSLISLNLGIFNLLPIPALDGGRFLFICIHWFFSLFSKKQLFPQALENVIHVFFFTLLILMSIFVAYNDILKLFQ